jgi:hypothetical protein
MGKEMGMVEGKMVEMVVVEIVGTVVMEAGITEMEIMETVATEHRGVIMEMEVDLVVVMVEEVPLVVAVDLRIIETEGIQETAGLMEMETQEGVMGIQTGMVATVEILSQEQTATNFNIVNTLIMIINRPPPIHERTRFGDLFQSITLLRVSVPAATVLTAVRHPPQIIMIIPIRIIRFEQEI